MSRISAAVVGLGYWGPNLARNFQTSADFELVALCDTNPQRLNRAGEHYPWAKLYDSIESLLKSGNADLIAIATPVGTHYTFVKAALQADRHVLCEKPLALTVSEASELVDLAAKKSLKLFVDHTFTYTDAVRKIKEVYQANLLGDLFYIDSVRINLGLFQPDVDVIWDLAPHDLSILNFVLERNAKWVQVVGVSHNPRSLVDVAYVGLDYGDGLLAYLHLSWLSPVKVRRMIFSGTKSSLLFDDIEVAEKVKIYDHGVSFDVADLETRKQVLVNYRRGDMRAPALHNREALETELKEISAAFAGKKAMVITGEEGLEVVRILEASERSLRENGKRILI